MSAFVPLGLEIRCWQIQEQTHEPTCSTSADCSLKPRERVPLTRPQQHEQVYKWRAQRLIAASFVLTKQLPSSQHIHPRSEVLQASVAPLRPPTRWRRPARRASGSPRRRRRAGRTSRRTAVAHVWPWGTCTDIETVVDICIIDQVRFCRSTQVGAGGTPHSQV